MAVRLRMAVHGVRNNRIFHIVAVNQRQRRNAKPIELLGVYNPRLKPGESTKTIEWSVQRIKYWLKVGATPSKSMTKLLQMGGILAHDLSITPNPPPEKHEASSPEAVSEAETAAQPAA
ncbi:ribosomal protein S16 [Trametes coccinea BRFM310]|uniref:Ribosomal protein S16 n=1 Tax=Trametes coccinea (strain BRFM310) TaxID=1353009 RepID=A0A1Y2IHU7_TRAC3|nr:ribosomal protein S16 [Trametes coccinea BRFM310]